MNSRNQEQDPERESTRSRQDAEKKPQTKTPMNAITVIIRVPVTSMRFRETNVITDFNESFSEPVGPALERGTLVSKVVI